MLFTPAYTKHVSYNETHRWILSRPCTIAREYYTGPCIYTLTAGNLLITKNLFYFSRNFILHRCDRNLNKITKRVMFEN